MDPVDWVAGNPVHSFNRYAYANNNPLRYIDPDGRYAAGEAVGPHAQMLGILNLELIDKSKFVQITKIRSTQMTSLRKKGSSVHNMLKHLILRKMRSTERFVADSTEYLSLLQEGEVKIGHYKNEDGSTLIFTTTSLLLEKEGKLKGISWKKITGYDLPPSKETATGVMVHEGEKSTYVNIPAKHGIAGRFKDSFCLIGILHVLVGINRQAAPSSQASKFGPN
ncbi:hypothetical protein YWS52_21230 [Chitiniphilus shinanonensis]